MSQSLRCSMSSHANMVSERVVGAADVGALVGRLVVGLAVVDDAVVGDVLESTQTSVTCRWR